MKTFKSIIILLTFVSALTAQNKHIATPLNPEMFENKLDNYILKYIDLDIFSGVVLVAEKGLPVYHKAFGLADREHDIPNTLDTHFNIGSMNKTFTSVVVLKLIEEGKLDYSDKMTDYLDGFKQPEVDKITIKQLLTHRSGFSDYDIPDYYDLPYEKKTISGITELAKNLDLLFHPGEDEVYSNTGYILLGAIIEKVTSKTYAQNVREKITVPLILSNTYLEDLHTIPKKTIGYSRIISGIEDNKELLSEPCSDGGFWATAMDVMSFYRNFFYNKDFLSQKLRDGYSFFEHIKPNYNQPGAAISFAGGMNGLNTVHIQALKEDISIVVLANMDEPVAEKIGSGILQILRNQEPENPRLPAVLNAYNVYREKGIDYLKTHFAEVISNFHPTDPKDIILNNLGYQFLFSDHTDDAIAIFKLNTELFPNIANCWDSYGEALLNKGEKQEALEAYKKALKIIPGYPSALKAVKEIEGSE